MTRKFYIMLLVVLGFCMMPSMAFACKTKTEKACCKKESSSKEKKSCCTKEKDSKTKNHDGCSGACKSVSCGCPTIQLGLSVFFTDLNPQLFSFSSKKQKYYYSEIFISSDFRSIWLPPKIS
jgi:hypothetical protein